MEKYNCKEHAMREFTYRKSGELIRFPVGVVYGAKDGPTLAVVGGTHGCEFCGVQAAIDLYNHLDPAKVCGKVVIVMIYNFPGFLNNTGFIVPQDGKNSGGTFPGSLNGTFSEVMSYNMYYNILGQEKIDFMIELHGGDVPEALTPFIFALETGNKEIDDKINEMSEAYNIANIIHNKVNPANSERPAACFGKLVGSGIPAILTESGQQGILNLDDAKVHEEGILNVMKKMGMLEGKLVDTVKRLHLKGHGAIKSEVVGMWYPQVKLEQLVKKGDKLGEIRDYFGKKIMDVNAPIDGMVTVYRSSPSVGVGNVIIEMHQPI